MKKALNDNIIIKKESLEETSSGGIIMAGRGAESQSEGIVLLVGQGILMNDGTRTKSSVKKGDRVLFSSGLILASKGEEYIILSEKDLVAIL